MTEGSFTCPRRWKQSQSLWLGCTGSRSHSCKPDDDHRHHLHIYHDDDHHHNYHDHDHHHHNEFAHIVGDSDALLDVDGDAFLFVDVLANLVEMILIMTMMLVMIMLIMTMLVIEKWQTSSSTVVATSAHSWTGKYYRNHILFVVNVSNSPISGNSFKRQVPRPDFQEQAGWKISLYLTPQTSPLYFHHHNDLPHHHHHL